jgi:alpha-ribazole phosphatase
MKITLVRHTSVACGPTICYGQSDVDVSASFETEANEVKNKLGKKQFDAVFSSPLQRCIKLADYCNFQHPVWDKRLLELHFGDWEMILWNEIADPHLENWYADWVNVKTTNGESFADQIKRVENFLNELKAGNYQQVLVFTHAGVIRSTAILLGLVDIHQAFSDYKLDYGQIIEFDL